MANEPWTCMIRQDYIMRQVAELIQALARVVSLRHRREYAQALSEVNAALSELRGAQATSAAEPSLEEWLKLCRKHEHMGSGLMVAVAELLGEQGDLLALENQPDPARRSRLLALGLLLEGLLGGQTFVSAQLLAKVDQLVEDTSCIATPRNEGLLTLEAKATEMQRLLPAEVSIRLARYYEARGMYSKAEDVLFADVERGDAQALAECAAFYARLLALDDVVLERGGLPRSEIAEGRQELARLGKKIG